jgi:hypothetical protein
MVLLKVIFNTEFIQGKKEEISWYLEKRSENALTSITFDFM